MTGAILITEVIPTLQNISGLQERGIHLPEKMIYALSKNLSQATATKKKLDALIAEKLPLFTKLDAAGKPMTVDVPASPGMPARKEYDFLSEEKKQEYQDLIDAECARELSIDEFNPHKVEESVLASIVNFPISYHSKLNDFGFVTTLSMVSNGVKTMRPVH